MLRMLAERFCKACRSFASTYSAGTCVTCGCTLRVDAGVCRPYRKQAALTDHKLQFHFGRLAVARSFDPARLVGVRDFSTAVEDPE